MSLWAVYPVLIGVHRAVHLRRPARLRPTRDRLTCSLQAVRSRRADGDGAGRHGEATASPDLTIQPLRRSCSCTASSSTARCGTGSPSAWRRSASARTSSTGRSGAIGRRCPRRRRPLAARCGADRRRRPRRALARRCDTRRQRHRRGDLPVLSADGPSRIGRVVLTNCDAFENFPPWFFLPLFLAAKRTWLTRILLAPMRLRALRHSPLGYGTLLRKPRDAVLYAQAWVAPAMGDAVIRREHRPLRPPARSSCAARRDAVVGRVRPTGVRGSGRARPQLHAGRSAPAG